MKWIVIASLLGMACLSGCSRSGGNISLWMASWSDAGVVPGINQGTVELVEFGSGADAVRIVVWTDLPSSRSATESSAFSQRYFSDQQNADGTKKLRLESRSSDLKGEQQGIVKVGDRSVALKDGRVILVSTQGETVKIQQLNLEPDSELWKIVGSANNVDDPQTELTIFAKTEPRVGNFFRDQVKLPEASSQNK